MFVSCLAIVVSFFFSSKNIVQASLIGSVCLVKFVIFVFFLVPQTMLTFLCSFFVIFPIKNRVILSLPFRYP